MKPELRSERFDMEVMNKGGPKNLTLINVAFGIPVPPVGFGGVERVVAGLSKGMEMLGWHVHVISVAGVHGRRVGPTIYHDVRVPSLDFLRGGGGVAGALRNLIAEALFMLQLPKVLSRAVNRDGDNVIQVFGQLVGLEVLLLNYIMNLGCEVAFQPGSSNFILFPTPMSQFVNSIERLILYRYLHLIAISNQVYQTLVRRYLVEQGRITLIPAGISEDYFLLARAIPRSREEGVILTNVGQICRRKNQMALVKAFEQIRSEYPQAQLYLIGPLVGDGDRSYSARLQHLVETSGLSSAVHVEGELDTHRTCEILSKTTVFVFPSLRETQGTAPIEAMAFGIPVVASNISSIIQGAGHSEYQKLLLPLESPNQIAVAVMRVLKDEGLRSTLSYESLRIADMYRWENLAKRYNEFYLGILGG